MRRPPRWNDSCRARLAETLADDSMKGTLGALSTGVQQGERWMLDDKNCDRNPPHYLTIAKKYSDPLFEPEAIPGVMFLAFNPWHMTLTR